MKTTNLNKGMVRVIAKKAIDHIQNDPEREVRNLIDVANMFVGGKFQKQFFEAATKELEKEDSPYYKIAAQAILKTDKEAILSFGMNFGYNSLTSGAKEIREFENKFGFNVPWTFLIELSENGQLDTNHLEGLIGQGEEMGIYSYTLILQRGYTHFSALSNVMMMHGDCAFMLLVEPDDLIAARAWISPIRLKNIVISVNINASSKTSIEEATRILREEKAFCSAFFRASKEKPTDIGAAVILAESYGYELLLLLQNHSYYIENEEDIRLSLNKVRGNLQVPVVPLDIMADAVMVDRNISSEGCLAIISDAGELHISNMETKEQNTNYNIMHTGLRDILSNTLPKERKANYA